MVGLLSGLMIQSLGSLNSLVKNVEMVEYSKLKNRWESTSQISQSLNIRLPERIVHNRKIICNCANNSLY